MNETHTQKQINLWNQLIPDLQKRFPSVVYTHLTATAGAKYISQVDTNAARLGLGLYGIAQNHPLESQLQPALEMRTHIVSIKNIRKGESVGYNCTFTAPTNMKIAVIPVGYYEGLDRRISNKGTVRVCDTDCPIVGAISMNMCSIDISYVSQVRIGDEVIVISSNTNDRNSVKNISEISNTIPYETFVRIPAHLKRIVI